MARIKNGVKSFETEGKEGSKEEKCITLLQLGGKLEVKDRFLIHLCQEHPLVLRGTDGSEALG